MDFSFDDNQVMLRDSVSRFVAQRYDFDTRRAIVAGDRDDFWALFAELGWLTVPFSEELGGLGGSAVDLVAIMEELGRGLVVEPFLSCAVLAGGAVAAAASDPRRGETLAALMAGELQLALAFAEPESRYELADIRTAARRDGDQWVVNGTKAVVLNAPRADRLVVSVRTAGERYAENGISLVEIPTTADGVHRNNYRTVDGEPAAEVRFADVRVPAEAMLGPPGDALAPLRRVVDRACLAVCAEALGAMEAIFRKTVDYTRIRKQFGVPLASFQALRHRMVDMYIELEQARSITLRAAVELDRADGIAPAAVSAAKSRVGHAARRIGEESVQLHGGIGITDELDVGHYFKRLTTIQQMFGSTDFHNRRFRLAS